MHKGMVGMKIMSRYLVLLVIVAFSLGSTECRLDDEGDLGAEEDVPFETLLYASGDPVQGTVSGIQSAQLIVVRGINVFTELWSDHASGFTPQPEQPAVAFGDRMVIAVFAGERPTAGYSITIEDIRENDEFIAVDVEIMTPGRGCNVQQVITQPHHMVVLDDSDKTVNFIQTTVRADPCD